MVSYFHDKVSRDILLAKLFNIRDLMVSCLFTVINILTDDYL